MTCVDRARCWLGLWLLSLAPGPALAGTIDLSTPAATVAVGAQLDVRVFGTGFAAGTDGGDLSLSWTPNLAFVGLAIDDPPWDLASYDATYAALGWVDYVDVFSLFETPGLGGIDFPIATLTLVAVAEGPAGVLVVPSFVGWSLGGLVLDDVAYGPELVLEVVAVPAPSAAVQIGVGLAALAVLGRRARPAR